MSLGEGVGLFLEAMVPIISKEKMAELASLGGKGIFSKDWHSSIQRSVCAGLLSLTFTQYKLGLDNKHQVDRSKFSTSRFLILVK